jgi:hypothetical protein
MLKCVVCSTIKSIFAYHAAVGLLLFAVCVFGLFVISQTNYLLGTYLKEEDCVLINSCHVSFYIIVARILVYAVSWASS